MDSIKLFIGLFVIGLALFLCVELVPPYYSNYEFQDAMQSEALFSANNMKSEDAIRDTVYKKARELNIPVTPEDIKVHRDGFNGSGSVSIEVPYVVHLDIPGYPADLHFDASVTNRGANN
jgi:hypothetical protein